MRLKATWKYNQNYWTSARRTFINDTFEYCLENTTFGKASNLWGTDQPDNRNGSQNCIHLYINKTHKLAQLTDRNCNDSYVLACQVLLNLVGKFMKIFIFAL
jgi:hypothetical protein